MRAVTQNRRMASAMGIRTPFVDAMTFGLGSGIAGLAGVALSQIDNVSPNLGQGYIIDSFMVVVFGGVGNLWGTLIGALTLGIANKFLEPYAGAVLAKILILVLIILFIQRRPRGLFALKGRAVEAMITQFALPRPRQEGDLARRRSLVRRRHRGAGVATCCCRRAVRCTCRTTPCRCSASTSATPCWRSPSTWSGAIAASSRSATARSSRSAATPWACT